MSIIFNKDLMQLSFKDADGVEKTLSTAALEQLKNISVDELEELQHFYHLSTLGTNKGTLTPPTTTPLSELVDVDLTGKVVHISENDWAAASKDWLQSKNVSTVESDPENDGYYFFVPVDSPSEDANEDWDGFFSESHLGSYVVTIATI